MAVQYAISSPSAVKEEGKGISAARCRYSPEGRLSVPLTHQREFIINTFDRRVFLLQTGLAGIASMLWCSNASAARAKDVKLAKAAVQYTDVGDVPDMDCDDCSQFIPGASAKALGRCKIVAGDINPHGHCIAFSPKPKR